MMELTTYTELEIAHRLLTSYAQKCRALHGHRYQVEITVASPDGLNKDHMIVDFKKLKEVVRQALDDDWDHASCFQKDDQIGIAAVKAGSKRVHLIDANPTLEWMVSYWAELLQAWFDKYIPGIILTKLTASETARNTVTWTRDFLKEVVDPAPPITVSGIKETIDALRDAPVCTAAPVCEPEHSPDDVPYLVSYRDSLGTYSDVVYSSLKGKALVAFCAAAVSKVGDPCGTVVVLSLSRLPA